MRRTDQSSGFPLPKTGSIQRRKCPCGQDRGKIGARETVQKLICNRQCTGFNEKICFIVVGDCNLSTGLRFILMKTTYHSAMKRVMYFWSHDNWSASSVGGNQHTGSHRSLKLLMTIDLGFALLIPTNPKDEPYTE